MSGVRVVVQCRLLSSRLPAKAMLPLGGVPAAMLVALRARNRGLDVVAAVADGAANDVLAGAMAAHGVPVVRGDEDDVLGRFAAATADLAPEDTVVRLTGDNPVPDGGFVAALLDAFHRHGGAYLGTHSPLDGLPYGLSAEAFTVAELRRTHAAAVSPADREHVTTAMRRRHGPGPLLTAGELGIPDLAHLRVTMDTADDYLRLYRLFDGCDAVAVPWRELVDRLRAMPDAPAARIPFRVVEGQVHGAFALGTVQLGLPYGAANRTGQPSADEGIRIVRAAIERGVTHVDTARAYGDSERVVGEALAGAGGGATVVTKLGVLGHLPATAAEGAVRDAVDASVLRSCRELRVRRLDVLLLHRWRHRADFGGAVWTRLNELVAEGVIGALGASVGTPAEAEEALAEPGVKLLQLPFNLLDWRWRRAGIPARLQARPDVVVHARSALLQGILAAGPERWPRVEGAQAAERVRRLDSLVSRLGRESRTDLCLAYVRAQPWITSTVLGMETLSQLHENVALSLRPPLTGAEVEMVEAEMEGAPQALLDPAAWPPAAKEG